jgi:hypothetical protein
VFQKLFFFLLPKVELEELLLLFEDLELMPLLLPMPPLMFLM